MTTFRQFLSEAQRLDNRPELYTPAQINPQKFSIWCETNAPMFLKNIRKGHIYRGMDGPNLGYINTNKMNRVSANTFNYYTLWMDNDVEWSDYPKRSKSLICATDADIADPFGEIHLIIPADNSKIGICNGMDLWGSFPHLFEALELKEDSGSMDDIMSDMHRLLKICNPDSNSDNAFQYDYSKLKVAMKATTVEALQAWIPSANQASNRFVLQTVLRYIDFMKRDNCTSIYDFFEKHMEPSENGFQVTTAANFASSKHNDGREVWVQGECATISFNFLKKECSSTHPLYAFAKKYSLFKLLW